MEANKKQKDDLITIKKAQIEENYKIAEMINMGEIKNMKTEFEKFIKEKRETLEELKLRN